MKYILFELVYLFHKVDSKREPFRKKRPLVTVHKPPKLAATL